MAAFRQPGPMTHAKDFFDLGTLSLSMSLIPGPLGVVVLSKALLDQGSSSLGLKLDFTLHKPKKKHRIARLQAHTDPKVWAELNEDFGTRIDFAKVARFEGGQLLEGYVPVVRKTGKVAGKSGVTIATGFDIGQYSKVQIKHFRFPEDVENTLLPYAALTKQHALTALKNAKKKDGHGPTLTKGQADAVDKVIKAHHLRSCVDSWNTRAGPQGVQFGQLSVMQQTVLFSRTFHQGINMPSLSVSRAFYAAAQQGDWPSAEKALRDYDVKEDWYKHRVNAEADLLSAE